MRQRDQVQKGGDEFLRKIDSANRRRLLGIKGDIACLHGRDWRQYLRQWKGHEDPRPRLTKTDFGLQRFGDIPPFSKEKVKIPTSKILNYCLDKNHKVGGSKAVAFEKVLGYIKDNYQELIHAIQENVSKYSPVYKGDNQHGQKFEIQIELTGPSG
ncbi:DUF6883 domain-containing protein [Sporolituus thermophilus]|uniref:DUF6883 domain-containing protein n=1 Tax=Sporolituus thermophilus DSM 23256 TaxID=1123285 RepID=A0A1G7P3P8_9FIRM|nr:DUF6883 domain-containing protein [Sporolituus thermophilus]SDF80942.1 hypothetical protein SAMN05660235_02827 [Sporolituus thermophilus DSM 23256]